MWVAADPGAVSAAATVVGGLLGATGAVVASWLVIRANRDKDEQATRKSLDKPRRRATHSDRLGRIEAWREQYADPVLHRVQNVFEWDDPKDDPKDRRHE